ncbi:TonB-dependent receptor domain-containing protein [Novosphingobium resinovorum]|uniref:TonB-dependent receptor domain-containing protein n=1 Tax=Novosphingobium resinovorum TaxID=158500 RepID=UPI002ED48765|nr:TonB-dependent receptor [Novosphingobium resinovorum]
MKRLGLNGVSKVAMLTCLAWPCGALAQAEPAKAPEPLEAQQPAGARATAEEIVVTGSRLATGFSMPTPVTAVTADEMQNVAPTTIAEALQQIPSLSGTQVTSSSGRGSGTSQTNGQSLLNLRNLGSYRTLVLLNGSRLGPTNVVGSVDINMIPKELVRKVDIVTGGASASYGSDAVAGVANFILDTQFEGLRLNASKGITTYGDNPSTSVSGAFGFAVGDNFRFVGSADYYKSSGIGYRLTGRKWLDYPEVGYANPIAGSTPTTITPENVRVNNATYGGYINSIAGCPAGAGGDACRALAGMQFVEGGALAPTDHGDPATAGSAFTSGGDGPLAINGISPDTERESFFGHAEFDLAPATTVWAEAMYSRSYTYNSAQPPRQNGNTAFTIYEGNPYLPAEVAAILAATPGTQTFKLSRYDIDWPSTDVRGITKVARGALGIKGGIGNSWSYDANVAYQHAHQDLDIYNTIERNKYAAADAVLDGNGNIVCRSTLLGYDPGCVPINLFGYDTASSASTDYMMAWNTADITLNQTSGEANVRGDLPFGFGAGDLSAAFGVAGRRLTAERVVDEYSDINIDFTGIRGYPTSLQGRYGGYQFYNPSDLSGKVTIYEAYGELGIPILKDKPFFDSLDLTLAGRYTHYSQSGWEPTWKIGLNWSPTSSLRLRANYSQDSRAPSVIDLFNRAQAAQANSNVPWSGASTIYRTDGQTISVGNPNLSPEKARTLTVGAVFQPDFLPGFQASLDYYRIKISGSILSPGAQNIIDACYTGNDAYCALITVDGVQGSPAVLDGANASSYTIVINPLYNLGSELNSGLDGEIDYRTAIGNDSLRIHLSGNYALDIRNPAGCVPGENEVGSLTLNCPYPRARGNLGITYETGAFTFFVQERFISSGVRDKSYVEGVTIDDNHVPAVFYTDFNLTAKMGEAFGMAGEFFFNVSNVFNRYPPNTTAVVRSWIEPSNPGLYDLLGRRFTAGVRIAM